MSLEIEGKVIKVLDEVTGQGKNGTWTKQDFIIETEGEYPKKLCFTAFGDKSREVKGLIEGEKVKVSFNAESREYNDRWYTNMHVWRIQKDVSAPSGQAPNQAAPNYVPPVQQQPQDDDDELPF